MDIVDIDIPGQRKIDEMSIKTHLLHQSNLPDDRQLFFGRTWARP
jgi:hypothetical protein